MCFKYGTLTELSFYLISFGEIWSAISGSQVKVKRELDDYIAIANFQKYILKTKLILCSNEINSYTNCLQASTHFPNLSHWGFSLVKFASQVEKFFVIFRTIAERISQNIKILLRK